MICADVQSLARAAPETTASPKISMGNADNSFDQFLEAVKTSDRPTRSNFSTKSKTLVHEEADSGNPVDQEKPVDNNPVNQKPINEKKTNEKPMEAKKTDEAPTDPDPQPEVVEESMQEAIASAVAAQIAIAAAPIQQVGAGNVKDETMEITPPAAPAISVMQEQQSPVIQLPETEPQPLPDELKQAMQQPKVEAADFQKLVDTASQNLDNQVVTPEAQKTVSTNTLQVVDTPEVKILETQEPAVKMVNFNAQPEDLAELEPINNATGVYAMTSSRLENLVQKETLPIVQKVSTEVAQLVREQGQSVRIQIHPENLGKIDLKLVSNSNGMKVVMTAEVPATAKLLETHLDQLQQQLADAGVSISGMSVNSQGAQGQFANPSQSQSQSNAVRVTTPEFPQDSETSATQTLRVSSSSLDYRI